MDGRERLFQLGKESAQLCLSFDRVALQALADIANQIDKEWQDEQETAKQHGADEQQGGGKDDDVDGVFDYRLQGTYDAPLHIGQVVRKAADDVALALAVKVADGKDGDAMVDIVA